MLVVFHLKSTGLLRQCFPRNDGVFLVARVIASEAWQSKKTLTQIVNKSSFIKTPALQANIHAALRAFIFSLCQFCTQISRKK
jgi:hypothetical protein